MYRVMAAVSALVLSDLLAFHTFPSKGQLGSISEPHRQVDCQSEWGGRENQGVVDRRREKGEALCVSFDSSP